jgi:hypothetical protein
MSTTGSEEAQAFLLRFWYERSLMKAGHWRGTVWHQSQNSALGPRPVASPDEAFALVRSVLAQARPDAATGQDAEAPVNGSAASEPHPCAWVRLMRVLRCFVPKP